MTLADLANANDLEVGALQEALAELGGEYARQQALLDEEVARLHLQKIGATLIGSCQQLVHVEVTLGCRRRTDRGRRGRRDWRAAGIV